MKANLPHQCAMCVWDINLIDKACTSYLPTYSTVAMEGMGDYSGMEPETLEKHCDRIISKSGADLGDAGIYF